MKNFKILNFVIVLMAALLAAGCSRTYNSGKVDTLNDKISAGKELSQDDYSEMIEQYGFALDYLVETTDSVMLIEDQSARTEAGNQLRSRPKFQEMQKVWADFGSTLFQARANSRLSTFNLSTYMELAPYSDRYTRNLAAMQP